MTTHRLADSEEWLHRLVPDFQTAVMSAVKARGVAHIALSGGSTPKPFYLRLNRTELPWHKIEWWLGDERTVLPTDDQSNEKMVRANLGLARAYFKFHSWHTAPDWEQCAVNYGRLLKEKIGQPAVFDVVLLGLGTDGHTASLFPGTPALQETQHNAVLNPVLDQNTTRLTVTYPVLNAARAVWFLVSGVDKAPMVERLQQGDSSIPAGCIQNPNQVIYWNA